MTMPNTIHIQPECPVCWDNIDPDMGQQWCKDDVWSGELCGSPKCPGVIPKGTKYVRANGVHLIYEYILVYLLGMLVCSFVWWFS